MALVGKRVLKVAGLIVTAIVALAAAGAGGWAWYTTTYHSRLVRSLEKAGYQEHRVSVDHVKLNVGVSEPRDGSPIVLIHGQASGWRQYGYALRDLSKDRQVYAIDVPGHGKSDRLESYRAVEVADVLSRYIETIGQPVVLSGHSSGGQLAALIAARHPELVSFLVLEDPPLFATELPEARNTWNYQDLAVSTHEFLSSGETDWQAYQWRSQKMWQYFGDSAQGFIGDGLAYHSRHPGAPIALWTMPPGMNEAQVYIMDYDPAFGDAFFTGLWNEGFDQEATLAAIQAPVTYIHCQARYDGEVLQAAASDEDAARAMDSLPAGAVKVEADSGHNFHVEKRKEFVEILLAGVG